MKAYSSPITVVIPALNEQGAIVETIRQIRAVCLNSGIVAEIVLVNDGSTDRTAELAESEGVKVLHHLYPLGYGRSLKDGIVAASNDTIVITDADGTYPIDMIPILLAEYSKGFHMVVGRREGEHYRESMLKMPLRSFLRLLVEFTAGQKIPDVNSGFRVFSRKEVLPFFDQLCDTFSFTTSVTLAYLLTGHFVGYVPLQYHARIGEKKVRLMKDSLRTLQYIVQGALYYNPIKIFLLCCISTLLFSAFCFVVAMLTHLTSAFLLGVGSILVTVVVFSLGLISDQLRQLMLRQRRDEQAYRGESSVVPFPPARREDDSRLRKRAGQE